MKNIQCVDSDIMMASAQMTTIYMREKNENYDEKKSREIIQNVLVYVIQEDNKTAREKNI